VNSFIHLQHKLVCFKDIWTLFNCETPRLDWRKWSTTN